MRGRPWQSRHPSRCIDTPISYPRSTSFRTKTITLSNPATWDDRNDAYFMAEYKRKVDAKTILALCFGKLPPLARVLARHRRRPHRIRHGEAAVDVCARPADQIGQHDPQQD